MAKKHRYRAQSPEDGSEVLSPEPDDADRDDEVPLHNLELDQNFEPLRRERGPHNRRHADTNIGSSDELAQLKKDLRRSLRTLMRLSAALSRAKPLPETAPEQAKIARGDELRAIQVVNAAVRTFEDDNEDRTRWRWHVVLAARLEGIFEATKGQEIMREQMVRRLFKAYSIGLDEGPKGMSSRTTDEGLRILRGPPNGGAKAARAAIAEFFFNGEEGTIRSQMNQCDFLPSKKRRYLGPLFFQRQLIKQDALVYVLHRVFRLSGLFSQDVGRSYKARHPSHNRQKYPWGPPAKKRGPRPAKTTD